MNEEQLAEFIADCQRQTLEFVESEVKAKKRKISKTNRGIIYLSIGEKCLTCDLTLSEPTDRKSTKSYDPIDSSITIEHILPLDLGGDNRLDNMVPMCYACNVKARCATQQYFVEHLVKENRGKTLSGEDKDLLNRFVEWSIRTVKSPDIKIDSKIQQYFETVREILATKKSTLTHSKSIEDLEVKIAELEKRIKSLENTLWKRTMRAIGSFFQRAKSPINTVKKIPLGKLAPQPQKEDLHNLDFTPEEFSNGLLRQKKRAEPVTLATLNERLIKEDSRFNLKSHGIKPAFYILEYCSDLLEIEGREKGEAIHYWINEKENPVKIEASFVAEKVTSELGDVDEFKHIIVEILSNSNNKISISALGQRFSKKVQSMGFENKKEFFKHVGISPTITLSKTINEYMPEEITLKDNHAFLNRRG
jgi:5-methylcytosine-specific restriction endonuclease McrA